MTRNGSLWLVVPGLWLAGCGSAVGQVDEQVVATGADESDLSVRVLSAQLRAQLEAAGGVGRFVLPESTDFKAIPQDPKNPLTTEKVALGRLLFHDPALLMNPKTPGGAQTSSCAACHQARAGFQAGRRQGLGEGGVGFGHAGEGREPNPDLDQAIIDSQPMRSPTAMNGAYQPNQLWNGQFGATALNVGTESQWTPGTPKAKNALGFEGLEIQAIAGQDVHRLGLGAVEQNHTYQTLFAQAYPNESASTRINQVNAGLAIAAFERTLLANKAPWQKWLKGDASAMSGSQLQGAVLFFGKAGCSACHTGPALNSMAFNVLGMGDLVGDDIMASDPKKPDHEGRGAFTGRDADRFAFKVPQLYNLRDVGFLGHGGTFHSVREVLDYKNRAQAQKTGLTQRLDPRFVPLRLSASEVKALTTFVNDALYDPALGRYTVSKQQLPSHLCPVVNDLQSRIDLGCD